MRYIKATKFDNANVIIGESKKLKKGVAPLVPILQYKRNIFMLEGIKCIIPELRSMTIYIPENMKDEVDSILDLEFTGAKESLKYKIKEGI